VNRRNHDLSRDSAHTTVTPICVWETHQNLPPIESSIVQFPQRELQDLTDAGILKSYRQGRMVYYQANQDSPLYSDLRGLLLKTTGLVGVLADALKPVASKLLLAFVYGSLASGEERSDSDIDLLVVGTAAPAALAVPLRHAREILGREINPTIYSPAEFAGKRAAKDHFLTRVLAKPKLLVLGSEDELGKATG